MWQQLNSTSCDIQTHKTGHADWETSGSLKAPSPNFQMNHSPQRNSQFNLKMLPIKFRISKEPKLILTSPSYVNEKKTPLLLKPLKQGMYALQWAQTKWKRLICTVIDNAGIPFLIHITIRSKLTASGWSTEKLTTIVAPASFIPFSLRSSLRICDAKQVSLAVAGHTLFIAWCDITVSGPRVSNVLEKSMVAVGSRVGKFVNVILFWNLF